MKRYLLFFGETYYPGGGWEDFHGAFDTIEDARNAVKARDSLPDWHEIVDTRTMSVVENNIIATAMPCTSSTSR